MSENQKDQRFQNNPNGQQQNQKGQQNQANRNQREVTAEEERTNTSETENEDLGTSMPGREGKTPVAGQENRQGGTKTSGESRDYSSSYNQSSQSSGKQSK
ncbi:MAG: hypothetical protein HYU69_02015 [Bacteroidetes bacterium]|nr:hypothetical protein [Bacteroidota bacterium]